MSFDLEAYCRRVGYDGPRVPTLETLQALHALHPAAIPFENLDPWLGMPVLLDITSLQRKLVDSKRGGYCYEHNLLFKSALEAIGFAVTGLAARVLWGRAADAVTPRTHMLLLVEVEDEQYLADVGFGGQTLTVPLQLELDVAQPTPHESFRLTEYNGDFLLQTYIRDTWQPLYRFDLQRQELVDYELASWYLSHHPQSPFVAGLRVARAVPGKRFNLLGNELMTHTLGAQSTKRRLSSADELSETLETVFGIALPQHPQLASRLQRLVTA
jgi:N-hydroxyarylamine O-acetyltransferase